ncbi:MAG: DEAD/DEAH box helicase [Nannocystaceae bacterium]|nr:DEAD/DEAH box helicase [Nannocystaceae bacterium]
MLDATVERLRAHHEVELVAEHRTAARPGVMGTWPTAPVAVDARLIEALARRGVAMPFEHQATAIAAAMAGRDVVVATSTASGKSLCFQVPILHAALTDPDARALLLFPTKALARDQCESLRQLVRALPPPAHVGVAPFDGDTPPDERRAARSRAAIVATNPDMLHRGVLPAHEGWARFLAGLRYIVLDELHTYRGVFGAHVGNVLVRLLRLCAHYGSRPQCLAASATIANPVELAQRLCGREGFVCVDKDRAPSGARTVLVFNPKVVDPVVGVRRDYIKVTRVIASEIRRAGVQSLVFCRTRKGVELLTRYLQEDERQEQGPLPGARAEQSVRGYRGGYLPERRREVEHALRSGQARTVATTNALELGIDIGGVDAVVLSGYPGSRASTLQRLGRAGRRGRPALGVMVLSSMPTDQFIAADPAFVFERPAEHAVVDPDNPEVWLPHLRCAAQELPLREDESWGLLPPEALREGAQYLAARGVLLRQATDVPVYLSLGADSAADQVDLRGPIDENFAVVDEQGDVLAEVAFDDAPLYLHPGAIYPIEGRTYEVRALDWDGRKATVRAVAADYYTEAIPKLRVRLIDDEIEVDPASDRGGIGEAHVVRTVPGFKKLRFRSHENIGFGPISLPDLELHTRAAYWPVPRAAAAQLEGPVRAAATLAAAHAIHHCAALLLMCDPADLGHAITAGHPASFGGVPGDMAAADALTQLSAAARPYVVLFDWIPGGAGLSSTAFALGPALFERALAAVRGCACAHGCPSCLGPQVADREQPASRPAVLSLLGALAAAAATVPA